MRIFGSIRLPFARRFAPRIGFISGPLGGHHRTDACPTCGAAPGQASAASWFLYLLTCSMIGVWLAWHVLTTWR